MTYTIVINVVRDDLVKGFTPAMREHIDDVIEDAVIDAIRGTSVEDYENERGDSVGFEVDVVSFEKGG